MIRTLATFGDSWTFGSEIRDPLLPPEIKDWDPENDSYRLPRTWPAVLGSMIGADVINKGYPAYSNDAIVRTTKRWIISEYLSKGRSTDDLFVVVGLTSPERKDFYYKDHENDSWITIWPMLPDNVYRQKPIREFHAMYQRYMWNEAEYIHRYVHQVLDMENFMRRYGVKYLFFQAFYPHKDTVMKNWRDIPYGMSHGYTDDADAWALVDPLRFMKKNDHSHSFLQYILKKDVEMNTNIAIVGQHPSSDAHIWWAENLFRYCEENSLW